MLNKFFRPKLIVGTLPVTLTNGTTADATQVMSDLNWVVNQINANAAPLASPTFTGIVTTAALNATNITASGTLAVTGAATLASVAGAAVATQADQETATSVATVVTPGRQQFHPSAAKGWARFNFTAGQILASYNLSSVTDVGNGQATVNWATDFSSADYAVVANIIFTPAGTAATTLVAQIDNTQAAGTTNIYCIRLSDYAAVDGNAIHVVAFGDQA